MIQAEILLFSLEFILINLVVMCFTPPLTRLSGTSKDATIYWRRQAVLNAMPLVKSDQVRHRGMNSGDDFAVSIWR